MLASNNGDACSRVSGHLAKSQSLIAKFSLDCLPPFALSLPEARASNTRQTSRVARFGEETVMSHDLANSLAVHLDSVDAAITYLAPSDEPLHYYPPPNDPPAGTSRFNGVLDNRRVTIHDMRPIAGLLDLEVHGFKLVSQRSAIGDFYDRTTAASIYFGEISRLLTTLTEARRAIVFDYSLRKRNPVESRPRPADRWMSTSASIKRPFTRVHGDYTPASAVERVRDVMGEEAAELLLRPFMIVNVWRPIRGPLHDAPLAMCDARSVKEDHLLSCNLIYQNRAGQIYEAKYDDGHRWYYAPAMTADEALVFKTFDSRSDGRARLSLHTAFDDPTAPEDMLPRESCEVRALVFL
jgi:hypothetical protein